MTPAFSPPTVTLASRPFIAFGQFAQHADTAAAAFLVFHRRELAKARKALQKARLDSGVPATVRFDGAALFDPAVRQARGLGTLGETAARAAWARQIEAVNAVPGMLRYTYLNTSAYPVPLDTSEAGQKERAILREVLFARCFAVPPGGTHGPQAHETEALVADTADRGAHAHAVLLDLADLVTHACARATAAQPGDEWIPAAIATFTYWSHTEVLARAPDPQPQ